MKHFNPFTVLEEVTELMQNQLKRFNVDFMLNVQQKFPAYLIGQSRHIK
jgi:hypothetical protein